MVLSTNVPLHVQVNDCIRICDPTQHFDNTHCKEFELLPGKYIDSIFVENIGAFGERPVEVQYVLEGHKDVELNESLGIIAIESACAYMGLSKKFDENQEEYLKQINETISTNEQMMAHVINKRYMGLSFITGTGDGLYRCVGGRDENGNLIAIAFVLDQYAEKSDLDEMKIFLKNIMGFDDDFIENVIQTNIFLKKLDVGDVSQAMFQFRRRFGLTADQIKELIYKNPWLLTENLIRLDYLSEIYNSIGIVDIKSFLLKNPIAMSLNPEDVRKLICEFRNSGKSDEQICDLFINKFDDFFEL